MGLSDEGRDMGLSDEDRSTEQSGHYADWMALEHEQRLANRWPNALMFCASVLAATIICVVLILTS